jgi:two-component system cell cycle response regulator CpdR
MTPAGSVQEAPRAVLAEDAEMLRVIIAETLKCAGFLVSTAADGAEALALIRDEPADLLVTDIRMPIINGYKLAEAALRLRSGLKVVLMTGHAPEDTPPSLRRHRFEVLQKPFDLDRFSIMARKLVGLPATR